MNRRVLASTLALGLALAACGDDSGLNVSDSPRCPSAFGEFGPTACAIVRGVALGVNGAALQRIAVQIDSITPEGDRYASSLTALQPNGQFELTVFRIPSLSRIVASPVAGVDTVSLVFKAYGTGGSVQPSEVLGRATAMLEFARLGAEVKTSAVEIQFDL